MKRFILLTLTTIILMSVLSACSFLKKSDTELVEARINTFKTAYNSGDFEKVLDCLDAKTRNAAKAMTNMLGNLGGELLGIGSIDIGDLFGLGAGLSKEDMMNLKIAEITIIGDTATVKASMKLSMLDSEESGNVVFTLKKEGNDWFISNMQN